METESKRTPSTRRASLSAKRAWVTLHKKTSFNSNNRPRSNRSIKSRSRSRSPSENQAKRANVSASLDLDLDMASGSRDFVTISSRPTSNRVKTKTSVLDNLEEKSSANFNSLTNTDETECKENIFMKDAGSGNDSDTEGGVSQYMQMREQNLRANQEFLARIGMQKAKDEFSLSVTKKKPVPSQRGLLKQKKEMEPLPRRHSLRIRRIDPKGVPMPEPDPVEELFVQQRLPETVSMKETHYSKIENTTEDLDLKPFLSTITALACRSKSKQNISPVESYSSENSRFVQDVDKLKITEKQVAKVVPGRIYSLAWHPSNSEESMIALAGDVSGYIGCWNVLAKDDNADIVRAFRPHIKPVTHMFVHPNHGHKLYTSSYDATLRCGDFEKGAFDLVFSVPEEDDDLFRNFDFLDNSSSMLVSHFRGLVSLVDTRTPSKSAEQVFKVSKYSLRKVSVHPVSSHYFITAGRDAQINLWDLRSMNQKAPIAVQCLKHHSKSIASAYFSPLSGNQILSSSSDDTIQIHSVTKGMNFELTSLIRHNNHTGRWLTPFQPTWHPTVEGIFVSGSMARPRQIEVFNSSGQLVRNLLGDNLASVCSLNAFHPTRQTAIVGANSSGRLHVFM